MPSTVTSPYRVAEGEVRLTITVGDGQIGTSTVMLGQRIIASGPLIDAVIGRGPEIKGKVLVCTTAVTDVLPETNRTSATYTLTGGVQLRKFILQEEVDSDATIMYLAVFTFTG